MKPTYCPLPVTVIPDGRMKMRANTEAMLIFCDD